MALFKILNRFSGGVAYKGEAEDLRAAVEVAVRDHVSFSGADLRWDVLRGADLTGASLWGADLRWANLRGASLRWAVLREADLSGADLSGADLRWANLRWAVLSGADLSGADLSGADLSGANLWGANLENIIANANNHALAGWILFQAAGGNWQRRCLAGGVLMSADWCWEEFRNIEHPEWAWAIAVLSKVQGFDERIREWGN